MTLRDKITAAKNIRDINALRTEVVAEMKNDHAVLKLWQDKYWSLKTCPTCGHEL